MGLYAAPERDANSVRALVEEELFAMGPENAALILPYMAVTPHFHGRQWDYATAAAPPNELYIPCWTVAWFPDKQAEVIYSDHGHRGWGFERDFSCCGPDGGWWDSLAGVIAAFHLVDGFTPIDEDD